MRFSFARELNIHAGQMVTNKSWWFALYDVPHIFGRNITAIGKAENAIRVEKIGHARKFGILTCHNAVLVENAFDLCNGNGSLDGAGLVQVNHDDGS